MKKILITGANSYIGTSFEKYIHEHFPDEYIIDTIDMIDGSWREKSFAGYDSVFHVAGIAHQKQTKKNAQMYYKVNRDLAIETAQKAKSEEVTQFIFLSSMSVYGMDTGVVTRETQPNPKSHYGKSKWEAEQAIATLQNDVFRICILRPPMVYGKGCKGNFNKVCALVEKLPLFPKVKNQRSMIYIDNLCSFVRHYVDKQLSGVFFPQNHQYVATMDIAQGAATVLNKKIIFDPVIGLGVRVLRLFHPTFKKAFGTLIYDFQDTPDCCIVSKMDSIQKSV